MEDLKFIVKCECRPYNYGISNYICDDCIDKNKKISQLKKNKIEKSKDILVCTQCKATTTMYLVEVRKLTNEYERWFIDTYDKTMSMRDCKGYHHLCGDCRYKNLNDSRGSIGRGYVMCDRCYKYGEWGEGKWNDNCGHIQNYLLDMTLCYDCNGRLYYNK